MYVYVGLFNIQIVIFSNCEIRKLWFKSKTKEMFLLSNRPDQCSAVFALECDFASLYTLWGELSQNQLTNASVLSLPGETLKTDCRNLSIIGSDDVHISS